MIVAQVALVPIGVGTGVSSYVKAAIAALREKGVRVVPNAMATVIEAENLEQIFGAVKHAHDTLIKMGVKRLITEVKIDDRRDKEASIDSKLRSIGEN